MTDDSGGRMGGWAAARPARIAFGLALCLALPAQAQPARAPAADAARTAAVTRTLLESANYWRLRGEPKVAMRFYGRVLTYAPNDPDALAAAAEVAFQDGDFDAAARYRARLAQVLPADPRNARLQAASSLTPDQQAHLNAARNDMRDGKATEAVAEYRTLFNGSVRPDVAVEYYEVLAHTTSEGFDEAVKQLQTLADADPQDLVLQLTYARVLILKEDTRSDGMKLLAKLSDQSSIAGTARQLWHDALLWQGPNARSRGEIEAYLKRNPTDPAIEDKLREIAAVVPDPGLKALMVGYDALASKDIARAKQQFDTAYQLNPNNADAAMALAIFYLNQNQPAEGGRWTDRAIVLAPDRRAEFLATSGLDASSLPDMEEKLQVSLLLASGKLDKAEQMLRQFLASHETAPGYVQLGNIQLQAGHPADAAVSFEKARGLAPGDGDAVCGGAMTALRQGQLDDASRMFGEAATLYSGTHNVAGLRRVSLGRAELVRARAKGLDAAASARLYDDAIAAEPDNMALRRDYASVLLKAGRNDQAWSVLAKGIEANHRDPYSLRVALEAATQAGDVPHETAWGQQLKAAMASPAAPRPRKAGARG